MHQSEDFTKDMEGADWMNETPLPKVHGISDEEFTRIKQGVASALQRPLGAGNRIMQDFETVVLELERLRSMECTKPGVCTCRCGEPYLERDA